MKRDPTHAAPFLLMRQAVLICTLVAARAGANDGLENAHDALREADSLRAARRFDEAVSRYRDAIARLESHGAAATELAAALDRLGSTHLEQGNLREGARVFAVVLEKLERAHDGDHVDVAASLGNLGLALRDLGRYTDALPYLERALAMSRRLFDGDDPTLAMGLNNLALIQHDLGRHDDALEHHTSALAMVRRLHAGDHESVALSLTNIATTLDALGRDADAVSHLEKALAMRRRLVGGDHPHLAATLHNLAKKYADVARHSEALAMNRDALAMWRRLFPGDHPHVAASLGNLALAVRAIGRDREALPIAQESLAMWRRVHRGDHPHVATALGTLAMTLHANGYHRRALAFATEAAAMDRRVFGGDGAAVATSLNNLAVVQGALGRYAEAFALHEEALAMRRDLFPGDHDVVADSLNDTAMAHLALGRLAEAAPLLEAAIAMRRRLGAAPRRTATGLHNLAIAYDGLGRHADALKLKERALAMRRTVLDGDHPEVALALTTLGNSHGALGRPERALAFKEEGLAMLRRIFDGDHADVALALYNVGHTLDVLGRRDAAEQAWRDAAAMGARVGWPYRYVALAAMARVALDGGAPERAIVLLRDAIDQLETHRHETRALGLEDSARYAAALRPVDPFQLMAEALVAHGRTVEALAYVERGRARAVLDLLERSRAAPTGGDRNALERARSAVAEAEAALVRRRVEVERATTAGERETIRTAVEAENGARRALVAALRRRHHLVRTALPGASPRAPAAIQALLADGERMLVYALGQRVSFVFVVTPPGGPVRAFALPRLARVRAAAEEYAQRLARAEGPAGGAQSGRALADLILPAEVRADVLGSELVYVLPHGPLHTVPFEALVVGAKGGAPRYWIDDGPPVAYAASGSVLAWLRDRPRPAEQGLSLVAVGDPEFGGTPAWPAKGILVLEATSGGQAAGLGLRPGDVILGYGGQPVDDLEALLVAARTARPPGTVSIRFERDGRIRKVEAMQGAIGVRLARDPPAVAGPRLPGARTRPHRGLARLPASRREVERIADVFREASGEARVVTLLGRDATEARLLDAAPDARFLHLATHGLVHETPRASFSALALTAPRVSAPGNDGLLTLVDLVERWRGRLDRAELVVLSACESQKGRLAADEGMLALPLGFCYAGARSVVGSLWRVDDETTAELMAGFYTRLFESGGAHRARALRDARRVLRRENPDPNSWAAFVLVGDPR